ncbi:Flp family type IVb pilin [Photobacterium indicum]|jgi:pilus assembly protein Flp/PilA|uniref:Flp family type IVb pilin n=1 Tax=Photobacterium indicum TaxID=81447 RepID=A0A2T3L5W8_9GAMM|nr:Flp family type IVb pilin [Photobacterium indicum]PSV45299.1 Flp family type IVb pilin [Photobacterium indicum]
MQNFKQSLIEFWKDEEGLTTVEYAIAGSLVGAAVVTAFTDLGGAVGDVIDGITTDIGGTPTP